MMRTVWRPAIAGDYVPRCTTCGGFKEDLKEHWFYSGMYCVDCIRYKLYDDVKVPYYGENNES